MDERIEALRARFNSLSYRELQKEAKGNSISAKQKRVKLVAALVRKLSRDYASAQVGHSSDDLSTVEGRMEREVPTDEQISAGDVTNQAAIYTEDDAFDDSGKANGTFTFDTAKKSDDDNANTWNVSFSFTNPKSRVIDFSAEATLKKGNFAIVSASFDSSENREKMGAESVNNKLIFEYEKREEVEPGDAHFTDVTFDVDGATDLTNVTFGCGSRLIDFVDDTLQEVSYENSVVKFAKSEIRENFLRSDLDNSRWNSLGTPIKAKPKLSYTPYKGTFKYVDTTKMSNREFEIYQQNKKGKENRVLSERCASVNRNDCSFV